MLSRKFYALLFGILIILLAFFGLLMEADQSLYVAIGITDTTNQNIIRGVAFALALLSVVASVVWLIFDYTKTKNNIIYEVFVKSIFQAFFEAAPKEERDKIFRVNLYKFYKSGTFCWRWEKRKRDWEYKKTIGKKDRRLEENTDYLLCHTRYGYKHGLQISNTTTYAFKVNAAKGIYRLFTGEIYKDKTIITKSALDNPNINEIIKKIPAPDVNLRNAYISLLNESPTKNFDDLLAYSISPTNPICLSQNEQNQLKEFMEKTNTLALDLFDINEGVHCNHFMGFKIFKNTERSGDTLWGVVTIDALEPSGRSFYNLVGVTRTVHTNPQWLEIMLKSFSKQLSNAISRL